MILSKQAYIEYLDKLVHDGINDVDRLRSEILYEKFLELERSEAIDIVKEWEGTFVERHRPLMDFNEG